MQNSIKRYAKPMSGLCLALALASAPAFASEPLLMDAGNSASTVISLMSPIAAYAAPNAGSSTQILQLGTDNSATSGVNGRNSLSVIQQSGINNRAVQAVEGDNSALLLVQGGSNNTVSQVAKGNNDFQLVGVSGNNNQVAYVQAGDNLAGVLDVRNAQNTTVLAIQTQQSGNYLMPTGLNGLSNANVVIVPGKMYVFKK